jgi:hypothetical protein
MRNGVLHDCRVVWRASPNIGVAFLSTVPLQDAVQPHHRTLRRLWLDSMVR